MNEMNNAANETVVKKKSKVKTIVIVAIALLVIGIIAGCASNNSETTTVTPSNEFSSTPSSSAQSAVYEVGSTIKTPSLEVRYLKCYDFYEENMFMQPDEGNKYIAIELEFHNTGSFDKHISSDNFIVSVNGYDFSGYNLTSIVNSLYLDEVKSGLKTVKTLVIQVPMSADANDINCVYEYDTFHSYTLVVNTTNN